MASGVGQPAGLLEVPADEVGVEHDLGVQRQPLGVGAGHPVGAVGR